MSTAEPDETISTTAARDRFADILNRAAYGKERVVLTRRGRPLVAVVPIEDVERLEALEDERDAEEGASPSRGLGARQGDLPSRSEDVAARHGSGPGRGRRGLKELIRRPPSCERAHARLTVTCGASYAKTCFARRPLPEMVRARQRPVRQNPYKVVFEPQADEELRAHRSQGTGASPEELGPARGRSAPRLERQGVAEWRLPAARRRLARALHARRTSSSFLVVQVGHRREVYRN